MTLATLQERVEFWQQQLSALGIAHWRVSVEVVDEPDNRELMGAKAAVTNSTYYDSFWMEFAEAWLNDEDLTDEELDLTIIHEFVHVAMRDLDGSIHEVNTYLGEPALSIWQSFVKHEREGFVDRIARALYESYMSEPDVVRSDGEEVDSEAPPREGGIPYDQNRPA